MDFSRLRYELSGDLYTDDKQRILYATDASSYRELPVAVTRPASSEDIRKIIRFAAANGSSVIPRGAGTSLAGQVVGSGIVVDVSKYMNRILELNTEERWVRVEPGVILAELNLYLARYGLLFGPETSTASRCCMAGMLGNNSCGLHSIIYGSVRDHILEAEVVLADGSEVTFKALSADEFNAKCNGDPELSETRIYQNIRDILGDSSTRQKIRDSFPHPELKRRNNGYAVDSLMDTDPFINNGVRINLCKVLAGSEGTLAFTTSMKLNLIPIPVKKTGLICAHFTGLDEALKANILILKHQPAAIELIDDFILNCTKDNIEQSRNRFFIKGEPAVILIVELLCDSDEELKSAAAAIENELSSSGLGYHFPFYADSQDIQRVWDLRKAGLGVLLNIPGERRSVQVIEDTSVLPEYLPAYIAEFEQILKKYNLNCSYYAHVATGELHLSPLLNLRDSTDVGIYRDLATDVAHLVKKYKGSLSGEHGDGRLRGEFIPLMFGNQIYGIFMDFKKCWDPLNIMNPGKIIDTPPMDTGLRYRVGEELIPLKTVFRFAEKGTLLFEAEKCSGSGDCRKNAILGGTMCPSFMATGDEDKSTRGRANILREFLTRSTKKHPYDHRELYEVMDLCLSCKACKSECPSNIDMTKFKAEFLSHYYQVHGIPFRTRIIGWLPVINKLGFAFRPLTNFISSRSRFKKIIGFAPQRRIPRLSDITLRKWFASSGVSGRTPGSKGKVFLFADEFTDFNESHIGIKAILLLERLGYTVDIPKHRESARTFLSKGMLRQARKVADTNVLMLKGLVTKEHPLLGLEPSAILTFRDEYPEILEGDSARAAAALAENALLLEEFICREFERGNITRDQFTNEEKKILLHGHCQQKSIASTATTLKMLRIPLNFKVSEIPSGCCGMAGAFGYEEEHYELSMKIGEMVLFPAVRNASADTLITAPGTSCRQQILDGTGRNAVHPAELMFDALKR